jgi:hypothetical protein
MLWILILWVTTPSVLEDVHQRFEWTCCLSLHGIKLLLVFWIVDTYLLNDDHVDGVILRLWTAATVGTIVNPHVIYKEGEPWWNDIDRENAWFVHQISLAILPAESSASKWEERAKGMMNLALRSIFVVTWMSVFINYARSVRISSGSCNKYCSIGCCVLIPNWTYLAWT